VTVIEALTSGLPFTLVEMSVLTGCPFAARCEFAFERCTAEISNLIQVRDGHQSDCFLSEK
jgi:peptide/nickel transport system ATP-binding protein